MGMKIMMVWQNPRWIELCWSVFDLWSGGIAGNPHSPQLLTRRGSGTHGSLLHPTSGDTTTLISWRLSKRSKPWGKGVFFVVCSLLISSLSFVTALIVAVHACNNGYNNNVVVIDAKFQDDMEFKSSRWISTRNKCLIKRGQDPQHSCSFYNANLIIFTSQLNPLHNST